MKRSVLLICLVMLMVAAALAQQTSSYTLSAKIPFPFIVRGETMPAGDYLVQVPDPTVGPMMIRQQAGKRAEFVIQIPLAEKAKGNAQLTFHRVGDAYFLMEISDPLFGVHQVQQGDRYRRALKLASTQKVVIPVT